MDSLLIIAAVILIIVGLIAVLAPSRAPSDIPVVAKPLMTSNERKTIAIIEEYYPDYRVHAQVSMGAIIKTKPGLPRKTMTSVRNRFDKKIIDYVIENKATGAIAHLIELDDRTHKPAKDKKRDAITSSAGYQTIRIPAGTKLTAAAIHPILAQISVR